MFLKYKVDIPVVPGKLVRKNRGGHTYIEYAFGLNEGNVRYQAKEIGNVLQNQ